MKTKTNLTPEEYLQALLSSAKDGGLKIQSLEIVSHANGTYLKYGSFHSEPNGSQTITIDVQEQTK